MRDIGLPCLIHDEEIEKEIAIPKSKARNIRRENKRKNINQEFHVLIVQ